MLNILVFDTSTAYLQLLFHSENQMVYKVLDHKAQAHDQIIFEWIDELKKQYPSEWKALQALGVIIGPGRFNALRLGCTIVATFQAFLNIPVFTLNNYDLMRAYRAKNHLDVSGYGIYAKKDHFYYRSDNDALSEGALIKKDNLPFNTLLWLSSSSSSDLEESHYSLPYIELKYFLEAHRLGYTQKVLQPIDLKPFYCALI